MPVASTQACSSAAASDQRMPLPETMTGFSAASRISMTRPMRSAAASGRARAAGSQGAGQSISDSSTSR